MNKFVITVLLSAFALGASAQSPAPDSTVQVEGNSADVIVIAGTEKTNDRHCLRETGSHVVSKHKKSCVSANGSAYSREDIERTGAIDLADALRRLDPSVQISRH